jgi:carboxypeptidase C (cathepsin A)
MLYIESPVGVGFSYSDTNDYVLDDDRTATENRGAVEAFFESFSEYKKNKFFITGESYAGIYVPTLAEAILSGEKDGTYTGAPLTGIAVGNGCSGTEVGICGNGAQVRLKFFFYILLSW